MKKTLIIFSVFVSIFIMCGCDLTSNNYVNDIEEETEIKVYYNDNESINLFINKYNEVNEPDITSEMISKKHIAGSDRDDVVTIANDKLEINIYENYKNNMSVYVGYKPQIQNQNDDFKEQFINYIKIFDETLTSDEINNYWNEMISEYRSSYDINDIDVVLGMGVQKGTISYFKFTSKVKF